MSSRQELGRFEQARASERANDKIQNGRAARTVADHAVDVQDCARLLAMLGLEDYGTEGPAVHHGSGPGSPPVAATESRSR